MNLDHFGVFSYEMANFHNKEARAVSNPRLVLHISPQRSRLAFAWLISASPRSSISPVAELRGNENMSERF